MKGTSTSIADRARGCLLGQLAGDSLGSLVEFSSAQSVADRYPGGPSEMADGGTWGLVAGQPTDDSELALSLARSIAKEGNFFVEAVASAYAEWYESGPFDVGNTTSTALSMASRAKRLGGSVSQASIMAANLQSQSNGALMRISPLAIFAFARNDDDIATLARLDASLTHPNRVCLDANAAYCIAVAAGIRGESVGQAISRALDWSHKNSVAEVHGAITNSHESPRPSHRGIGWVVLALQGAFHELRHAPDPATGIRRTILRGGDTDTTAAIAGALLGAFGGEESFPASWKKAIENCRNGFDNPRARHPRPPQFSPSDYRNLADMLAELARLA